MDRTVYYSAVLISLPRHEPPLPRCTLTRKRRLCRDTDIPACYIARMYVHTALFHEGGCITKRPCGAPQGPFAHIITLSLGRSVALPVVVLIVAVLATGTAGRVLRHCFWGRLFPQSTPSAPPSRPKQWTPAEGRKGASCSPSLLPRGI